MYAAGSRTHLLCKFSWKVEDFSSIPQHARNHLRYKLEMETEIYIRIAYEKKNKACSSLAKKIIKRGEKNENKTRIHSKQNTEMVTIKDAGPWPSQCLPPYRISETALSRLIRKYIHMVQIPHLVSQYEIVASQFVRLFCKLSATHRNARELVGTPAVGPGRSACVCSWLS